MTDLENLQTKDNRMEAETTESDAEVLEQILSLFQQLSPTAQEELLEALREDLDGDLSKDDDE